MLLPDGRHWLFADFWPMPSPYVWLAPGLTSVVLHSPSWGCDWWDTPPSLVSCYCTKPAVCASNWRLKKVSFITILLLSTSFDFFQLLSTSFHFFQLRAVTRLAVVFKHYQPGTLRVLRLLYNFNFFPFLYTTAGCSNVKKKKGKPLAAA